MKNKIIDNIAEYIFSMVVLYPIVYLLFLNSFYSELVYDYIGTTYEYSVSGKNTAFFITVFSCCNILYIIIKIFFFFKDRRSKKKLKKN